MEFNLQSPLTKKSRLTIGFLDENTNSELYGLMMPGVLKAAGNYQVNLVRFAYYPYHFAYDHTRQVKMVLNLISQFNLDGLLFLGWTRAGALHNYKEFTRQFQSIPLLSIGTGFEDIPYVYSPGNAYIREIILHLIQVHHRGRIAYIAPAIPDNRNQTYLELMKEHDIHHPELYVDEKALKGVALEQRARRALEILLEERRVTFDAIMSMYSEEAVELIHELNRRGFQVPQDIAVTSFDERDFTRYSSPGLTTVYFPWIELGFYGCKRMVELLTEGHIPLATEAPGKVIYRNSCGCMSSSVKIARGTTVDVSAVSRETLSELDQKKIVAELESIFPHQDLDFNKLLDAFLKDFATKTQAAFFTELASQLRKINYSYIHSNIKDLISVFRGMLLPYLLKSPDSMLWAGNLFQQAQVMAWEKITNVYHSAKISANILSQTLQETSQILITSFSTEHLMESLAKNLPKLKIPGCYIFLFNSDSDPSEVRKDLFDDCILAFAYSDYIRHNHGPNQPAALKEFLSEIVTGSDSPSTLSVHLLHVTDEFMGFILFEPGPIDHILYQSLATQISIALRGAQLLEKLTASYQDLAEQAHREGMADISIEILHNIGNILNSINVSVSLIKNAADSMIIPYLLEANQLLAANLTDLENFISHDPKGKKLMQFYLKLGISFVEFKSQVLYNAKRLDEKVNSIVDMISAQQAYAGVGESIEKLDIASILDDAIKLMAESLEKYQIKIIKDYQVRPQIMVQRLKLFHILFKLINNAKEAMTGTPAAKRKLTLTIREDDQGKYIRISDNGSGIPGKLLEKIFEFGYPRQNGQELGLHSCMKYMIEMGGKIWAESDGAGQGTTFVLQFSV